MLYILTYSYILNMYRAISMLNLLLIFWQGGAERFQKKSGEGAFSLFVWTGQATGALHLSFRVLFKLRSPLSPAFVSPPSPPAGQRQQDGRCNRDPQARAPRPRHRRPALPPGGRVGERAPVTYIRYPPHPIPHFHLPPPPPRPPAFPASTRTWAARRPGIWCWRRSPMRPTGSSPTTTSTSRRTA